MKIVAIGGLPFDLELACMGTLNRAIANGHTVHILIASDPIWTHTTIETSRSVFQSLGASEIRFTEKFDYSSVTQSNANLINSFVRTIEPSVIIIPFWKSHNRKRRILANTSLVACRGIGNVLMYELEKNISFMPNVYFSISADDVSLKRSYFAKYWGLVSNPEVLSRKASHYRVNLAITKKFPLPLFHESHPALRVGSQSRKQAMTVPNSLGQHLVFDGISSNPKLKNFEKQTFDFCNTRDTSIFAKPGLNGDRSHENSVDLLVEEFESHRLLLIDDNSEWF